MSAKSYVTVVETSAFIADAERCFSDAERDALIEYLAANPTAGVIVRGTGGVRKLRWRAEGRGKRGGIRVIYFFHNEWIPIFLLTAYVKSSKSDLTRAERRAMRALTTQIVAQYSQQRAGRGRGKP